MGRTLTQHHKPRGSPRKWGPVSTPRSTGEKQRPCAHLALAGGAAGAHGRRGAWREAGSHRVCTSRLGAWLCSFNWPSLPRALFSHIGSCSIGETEAYTNWTPGPGGQQLSPWGVGTPFQVFVLSPRVPGATLTSRICHKGHWALSALTRPLIPCSLSLLFCEMGSGPCPHRTLKANHETVPHCSVPKCPLCPDKLPF